MFVPPYAVIARLLGMPEEARAAPQAVEVPVRFLELLMRCVLVGVAFDEIAYLRENADLRTAVQAGRVRSPRLQFINEGYFRGRRGGAPVVDEGWYLRRYPDAAHAFATGQVASATAHYHEIGMFEWRAPNPRAERQLEVWRACLFATPAVLPGDDDAAAPEPARAAPACIGVF
jgi:hypothetical protein